MATMGYFTEIEKLQNQIKELECKLEQERQEFRDAFMRMKAAASQVQTSSNYFDTNPFYEEVCFLREENARLVEENEQLKQSI
jgi:hypothetical protein